MSTTPAINGKNLRQGVFSCFAGMLLVCCYTHNDFLLYVHFECRQADDFATVSSLVLLTPAINYHGFVVTGDKYHQCRCYRR